MLVLPRDAALLGIDDPDELEVAIAVRMSMSIPIYSEPAIWRNARTGEDHVIVDGGCCRASRSGSSTFHRTRRRPSRRSV